MRMKQSQRKHNELIQSLLYYASTKTHVSSMLCTVLTFKGGILVSEPVL